MVETPGLAFRILRFFVFLAGDIRRLKCFPYLTWDVSEHQISLDEALRKALPLVRPGDVILHRDDGYLSNCFIGGAMVHASVSWASVQLWRSAIGRMVSSMTASARGRF